MVDLTRRRASLIFYDVPGKGVGVAAKAFDHGRSLASTLLAAQELQKVTLGHLQHPRYYATPFPLSNLVAVLMAAETVCNYVQSSMLRRIDGGTGVDSPRCKEYNEVRSKLGAMIVLKDILNHPIDAEIIPHVMVAEWSNTIEPAPSVRAVQGVQVEKDLDV